MNILILSCGTRNKIVQYFKKEFKGRGNVIATDCSKLAPALYEADKQYIVPSINTDGYIDSILDICKKEQIDAVFSLIDPELILLAKYKEKFLEVGTVPIVSDLSTIELCFDKYGMYQFLLNHGFHAARSYIDKDVFYKDKAQGFIDYPVFVKPVKGSASIHINKVYCDDEIELLFQRQNDLMIQEFMDGIEYGIDAYIDLVGGDIVALFIKEKIKMRAGETDKSVSVHDENLSNLLQHFIKLVGFRGMIDIDVFKVNGTYYISEVNPRFGGGYPHAYECGVNIPKMIMNNLKENYNANEIGNYNQNIIMMKYNDVKMIKN